MLNPECGSQEFWFYKGVDLILKTEFDKRICSDNVEEEQSKTQETEAKVIDGQSEEAKTTSKSEEHKV